MITLFCILTTIVSEVSQSQQLCRDLFQLPSYSFSYKIELYRHFYERSFRSIGGQSTIGRVFQTPITQERAEHDLLELASNHPMANLLIKDGKLDYDNFEATNAKFKAAQDFLKDLTKPTNDLYLEISKSRDLTELVQVLQNNGWSIQTETIKLGKYQFNTADFGLIKLSIDGVGEQTIYLSKLHSSVSRQTLLKMQLALEKGQNIFISDEAVPAYIATRGYTHDIAEAMEKYGRIIEPDLITYDPDKNDYSKNSRNILFRSTGFSITLEVPSPLSHAIATSSEQIPSLIRILTANEGQISITKP